MKHKRFISIVSALVLCAMPIMQPMTLEAETTNELYPYTLFAASEEEGAITTNASNFCVNGSVATNGSILSNGNFNVNGTKTENAGETMIYIQQKIENKYFSGNVKEIEEDYILEETNININEATEVNGDVALTGNININDAFMAVGDIVFDGDVKNSNNSVIFSKYGNIVIDSQNVNLNGLVYAPFGDVVVSGQNLNLNSVIIIANKITFDCPNVNANTSNEIAKFVGNTSEKFHIPYADWGYLPDSDGDGIPDYVADYNNWQYLIDTDDDWLPDCMEEYLGSDITIQDTDGDELPDGYEFFVTLTDCTMYDSLGEGLSDGEYDFDEDGLNNKTEYNIGTRPDEEDYDYDGLSDGEEVNCYGTDPMNSDTDEEGLKDGDEIILGTSPFEKDTDGNSILDCDEKFMQEYVYAESDTSSIIDEVVIRMNATGNVQNTTTVESMKGKDPLCEDVVGLVGAPYSIETKSVFDTATISFKVNVSQLNEKSLDDYIILWYDEENYTFVEMETKYDEANGLISTETTHFSRYMVVDADAWFKAWSEELNYTNTEYEESRVYTVLAVDCSGSMSSSDPITAMPKTEGSNYYYNHCKRYEAVSNYIQAMDSDDKAAIVKFNSYANTLCALTDDKIVLTNAAETFRNGGGTNYDNALNTSIQLLNNSEGSTRKKIVLLTDGESSVSDSILESAKTSNIKIYTIGLGDSSDSVLQYIAEETGGQFFKAYTADELLDIYDEIGVTVEVDTTDLDEDELYDVYEVTGMRVQNGNIIYTDPTDADSDDDKLVDGYEIDTEIQHREVCFPSDVPMEATRTYFIMHSNPTLKDSDGDRIEDIDDIKPLWYEYTPTEFLVYLESGYIQATDLRRSDDGFTICMKPLGEIMDELNIVPAGYNIEGQNVNIYYFSDWYIYGFVDSDGNEIYSLIKFRTSNNKLNNSAGVSIPFRDFNISLLNESYDSDKLGKELDKLTQMGANALCNENVRGYFARLDNETNYFLAEVYLELIVANDSVDENGVFYVPDGVAERVSERLNQSQNIYNPNTQTICVEDINNLTLDEQQCLLASRAGTISYNAFAAEIIVHAIGAYIPAINIELYVIHSSAKKADLSSVEESLVSKGESLYGYDDLFFVKDQGERFGKY